jgi:hypothetical protein
MRTVMTMGDVRAGWIVCALTCGAVTVVAMQDRRDDSRLTGVWTSSETSGRPATLTFLPGGFYEVEFRGDEALDVAGRYRIAGGRLAFIDETGTAACTEPEFGEGTYAFTIRNSELTLDAVKDRCDGRVVVLERRSASRRAWTRKPS